MTRTVGYGVASPPGVVAKTNNLARHDRPPIPTLGPCSRSAIRSVKAGPLRSTTSEMVGS